MNRFFFCQQTHGSSNQSANRTFSSLMAWATFCLLVLGQWNTVTLLAADQSPQNGSLVNRLPVGAVATVEVAGLERVIHQIENSGALRDYLSSPLYDEVLKNDGVRRALAGKAIAEAQLGMSLWQAAKTYLGDRLILGVYPPTNGREPEGVLVIQVKDAGDLTKLTEKLKPLVALAGDGVTMTDRQGGGKQFKLKDGNEAVALDRWIVVSKQQSLLDGTLSNLVESKESGLAGQPAWTSMAQHVGTKHEVQLCIDMIRIRELNGGKRFVPEKLDNPVFSLLYGGLVESAAGSPYFGATLDLAENGFALRTAISGKASQLDDAHRALVVSPERPQEPFVPSVPGRLGAISFSRDLVTWYKAREKLLEAKLLPEFDKFETGIATFLPGKDFAEDVLPVLTGRIAFLSAPQDFINLEGKPGVQLPSFALVFELAKPAEGADLFNLVSQTLLTIGNFQASQEKRQPWVQTSESYHNVQINFARYLQRPKGDQLSVAFNFQPASALVGNRFVMSSTLQMCRQLVDALQVEATPTNGNGAASGTQPTRQPNFVQEFHPAVGADLIEANASVIHARNIQQGKTANQSQLELDALCRLLRQLTPIRFDFVQHAEHMALELTGGWK